MKSEEQTELPLSTPIFPGINQCHPHGGSFWRGQGKATLAPWFIRPPLGKTSCFLCGLLPCAKVLQVRRELSMKNEIQNVCLVLVFFANLTSNRAKVIWSPHNAQRFQGTAGSKDVLKQLALWDENHVYERFVSKAPAAVAVSSCLQALEGFV